MIGGEYEPTIGVDGIKFFGEVSRKPTKESQNKKASQRYWCVGVYFKGNQIIMVFFSLLVCCCCCLFLFVLSDNNITNMDSNLDLLVINPIYPNIVSMPPENFGFLTLSGGIEMEHWAKLGWEWRYCYDVTDKTYAAFLRVQALAQKSTKIQRRPWMR